MKSNATPAGFPNDWRQVLSAMEREWTRLHQEVAQLRSERAQLSQALIALMGDEVSISEEEILAQIGREKPLREFLGELRTDLVEK